ncbi:MAG: EscU/YscU/HrcU family type III secretion system export apparatus switch protein [Bryobacteraceae bacterium]
MADKSQQTEQATPRRIDKARREGNFPTARQFVSALQFVIFVTLLSAYASDWFRGLEADARRMLQKAFERDLSGVEMIRGLTDMLWRRFSPMLVAGGVLLIAMLGSQLAVTRFGVSLHKLVFDWKRISPMNKLRDLPRQNVPALVQALLMLPIFGVIIYGIAKTNLPAFLHLPLAGVETGVRLIANSQQDLLWKASMFFMAFGCVDLIRQRRRYANDLKMSKQDIQDEIKEMEGNPIMRARIRRLRRDLLQRRMMRDVPKSTAVIVNPTHFAVAIRYQLKSMAAPVVTAKGKNYLALRIRAAAVDHGIPLIENPPLAQALYKSAEVGQEIPPHLYRAVAEILAYIYRIMKGRLPGYEAV